MFIQAVSIPFLDTFLMDILTESLGKISSACGQYINAEVRN